LMKRILIISAVIWLSANLAGAAMLLEDQVFWRTPDLQLEANSVKQTFISRFPSLAGIKLAGSSGGIVFLFIKEDGKIIRSAKVSGAERLAFTFAPIAGSQNEKYALELISNSKLRVAVSSSKYDHMSTGGDLWLDGRSLAGDLGFNSYDEVGLSFCDVLADFWVKMLNDKIFSAFYGLLMLLLAFAVVYWTVRPIRR
jgi:hypothetical protein